MNVTVNEEQKQLVGVLGIIEKGDYVLMNLRRDRENPLADNKWEFPGGGIEFGERPEEALEREVEEETGYRVRVDRLLPYIHSKIWADEGRKVQVILLSYACTLLERVSEIQTDEVRECKWVKKTEIREESCLPGVLQILQSLHSTSLIRDAEVSQYGV